MAGKIFINYRRGDDPGFTQALYQRLEDEFGPENLFMDVEGHIKPGDDFVTVLDKQVGDADIVLAVIGPRWTELLLKRIGDEDDFVAIEIKSALDRAKRVVPVLVGGALMPRADALPETIRPLARRNAVGLRPERFKADCLGLIGSLKEQLAQADKEREATARERAAAEEARRQREAQEAARFEALESSAPVQPQEGIDPVQLRKAEELANWQYVGERGTLADLRDHLARYPGGVTERAALLKLETLTWDSLGPKPRIEELQNFIQEFPTAKEARELLNSLQKDLERAAREQELRDQETIEWLEVSSGSDIRAIEAFLKRWPNGIWASKARVRLSEMKTTTKEIFEGYYVTSVAMLVLGGSAALIAPSLGVSDSNTIATVVLGLWLLLTFAVGVDLVIRPRK